MRSGWTVEGKVDVIEAWEAIEVSSMGGYARSPHAADGDGIREWV